MGFDSSRPDNLRKSLYTSGLRRGPPRLLRFILIVNNFFNLGVDFLSFMRYTICIESERLKIMKTESIFTVTFTDGGEVFIKAMDEAHARRIIENNGQWRRNTEEKPFDRCIEKIEKN